MWEFEGGREGVVVRSCGEKEKRGGRKEGRKEGCIRSTPPQMVRLLPPTLLQGEDSKLLVSIWNSYIGSNNSNRTGDLWLPLIYREDKYIRPSAPSLNGT